MSTISSSPAGWKSILPRLKSRTPSGRPYSRSTAVEEEISRVLRLHHSLWIKEAPNLKNETIVFLMRLVRRADEQLFYELFQELGARIVHISRRWASGYRLDTTTVEEIVDEVELKVLELVLADKMSRQSDFLEVAFGQAVKRRALNRARKHNNSMQAHLGWIEPPADFAADDEVERPLELVPDGGPSPEAVALTNVLLERAWAAIDDPRIFQALFLHYHDGWPISSNDPKEENLVHFCGATRRHVKYMLEKGLEQMRNAIGENK
jgi:hypothetical protein